MELYVVRHAMAVEHGSRARDSERPLSEDGRKRMHQATKAFDTLGVAVDGILTSPYRRARETAELAAETLGIPDRIEDLSALAPGGSARAIAQALRQRCDESHRVMIVGHEPELGSLIGLLVCGDESAGFRMKKGGLSKLVIDDLRLERCAVLEWHLWPRHLLRMG